MLKKALILLEDEFFLTSLSQSLENVASEELLITARSDPFSVLGQALGQYHLIIAASNYTSIEGIPLLQMMKEKAPATKFVILGKDENDLIRCEAYQAGAHLFFKQPWTKSAMDEVMENILLLMHSEKAQTFEDSPDSQTTLVEWIDWRCQQGATTQIEVTSSNHSGLIFIRFGDLWEATTENSTGLEALKEMLNWESPCFYESQPAQFLDRTIHQNLAQILLDMVHADEEEPPPLDLVQEKKQHGELLEAIDKFLKEDEEEDLLLLSQDTAFWRVDLARNVIEATETKYASNNIQSTFDVVKICGELAEEMEAAPARQATLFGRKHTQEILFHGNQVLHSIFPENMTTTTRQQILKDLHCSHDESL